MSDNFKPYEQGSTKPYKPPKKKKKRKPKQKDTDA